MSNQTDSSVAEHFLFPSTLFASTCPHRVLTILGSCIAVCLHDPVRGVGGINHYMLPWWDGKDMPSPKFGNVAIERLVEKMLGMGCRIENLSAKIFGGANQHALGEGVDISVRNTQIARRLLTEYRIPIIAESVGGYTGRKIIFQTNTSRVWMKYLENGSQTLI
jgi:chemotaxis protein CheD